MLSRDQIRTAVAAAIAAAGLAGCAPKPVAPVVPITSTSAFVGSWAGTWDCRWERGTTTFAVTPDGKFTGTMHSTMIGKTWSFTGSLADGVFTGQVPDSPTNIYVLNGSAAVYGGRELKSQGAIHLKGKPLGNCVFDVKR